MSSEETPPSVPPPLKKTKRGLSGKLAAVSADEPSSDVSNVYSSCVQRSSVFSLMAGKKRTPLIAKQHSTEEPSQQLSGLPTLPSQSQGHSHNSVESSGNKAAVGALTQHTVATQDLNSSLVDDILSPPPPPPPPPAALVAGSRRRRMPKKVKSAFQALDSMKGELARGAGRGLRSPDSCVLVLDDSPARPSSIVVRVKHLTDIHKFSMAKSDLFFSLQQQMAAILGADSHSIGLFLNDSRLSPADTPLSVNLHLADIIECHRMLNQDAEGEDVDSLPVRLQCPNTRHTKQLTLKKYLPFRELFEAYAKMRDIPVEKLQFRFDGEILDANMYPKDVDLDEDDTIDVIEL